MAQLPFGKRCTVHVNLHRQAQGLPHFAITVSGKVVGYARSGEVDLIDAVPKIACSTYERSRTAGAGGKPKRAVYAKVAGILARSLPATPVRMTQGGAQIAYAPFASIHLHPDRGMKFTRGRNGATWTGSRRVRFVGGVILEIAR